MTMMPFKRSRSRSTMRAASINASRVGISEPRFFSAQA